jgi:hypothetical protein
VLNFLAKLLLGNGTLTPELRAELESEGLVLIEEGLRGSLRYTHYRAPGKRFNGKVTPERIGLGISEERIVAYCKSGRVKLMNSTYSNPHLNMVDVSLKGDDTVEIQIDYDRADPPQKNVSGQIKIVLRTPNAPAIVDEMRARLGR